MDTNFRNMKPIYKCCSQCHMNPMMQANPIQNNVHQQPSQNNFQFQQKAPIQMQNNPFFNVPPHQQGVSYNTQNPVFGQSEAPNQFQFYPNNPNPYQPFPQQQQQPPPPPRQPIPQNILDQIQPNSTPIFILPSTNCPQQQAPAQFNGTPYPCTGGPFIQPIFYPNPIYPYPILLGTENSRKREDCCTCSSRNCPLDVLEAFNSTHNRLKNFSLQNTDTQHRCQEGPDETICVKKNCPSSLSLQALISQLLSIPGIVSCAITRLLLKKIPGTNIHSSVDEIVERAQKSINGLSKDELINESRNIQQINGLIHLHMSSSTLLPINTLPILTMVQLKLNLFKVQLESLVTSRVLENQGVSYDQGSNLDPVILSLKSDEELRQLLVVLREKECDERVGFSFAPYKAQREIASHRLKNVQNKIGQVEDEMERRRVGVQTQSNLPNVVREFQNTRCQFFSQDFESPDPFYFHFRNPKRLTLMKPGPKNDSFGKKGNTDETEFECSCRNSCEDLENGAKKKLENDNNDGRGSTVKLSPSVLIVIESDRKDEFGRNLGTKKYCCRKKEIQEKKTKDLGVDFENLVESDRNGPGVKGGGSRENQESENKKGDNCYQLFANSDEGNGNYENFENTNLGKENNEKKNMGNIEKSEVVVKNEGNVETNLRGDGNLKGFESVLGDDKQEDQQDVAGRNLNAQDWKIGNEINNREGYEKWKQDFNVTLESSRSENIQQKKSDFMDLEESKSFS